MICEDSLSGKSEMLNELFDEYFERREMEWGLVRANGGSLRNQVNKVSVLVCTCECASVCVCVCVWKIVCVLLIHYSNIDLTLMVLKKGSWVRQNL